MRARGDRQCHEGNRDPCGELRNPRSGDAPPKQRPAPRRPLRRKWSQTLDPPGKVATHSRSVKAGAEDPEPDQVGCQFGKTRDDHEQEAQPEMLERDCADIRSRFQQGPDKTTHETSSSETWPQRHGRVRPRTDEEQPPRCFACSSRRRESWRGSPIHRTDTASIESGSSHPEGPAQGQPDRPFPEPIVKAYNLHERLPEIPKPRVDSEPCPNSLRQDGGPRCYQIDACRAEE